MPEQQTFTRAAGKISSVDPEQRTVELCFASETPVPRYSYEHGRFLEVLRISKDAIDASRLQAGMSLLDSHRAHSVDSILGSVVPGSFRIESGMAFARIKFSRRQRAQELLQDLVDGHRLPISVGYKIQELEEKKRDDGSLVLTATRWTPTEISIVAVPADPVAGTRNEEYMPTISTKKREAAEQDNTRENDIRSLARTAGIDESSDLMRKALEENQTLEEFRSAMLDHLIAKENEAPTFPHSPMFGAGNRKEFQARQDALYARMTGTQPKEHARQFMDARLEDHARSFLEHAGHDTRRMARDEVFQLSTRHLPGMHTTNDFPMLLQGAGTRVLMDTYELAQSPVRSVLAKRATLSDFRAHSRLKMSELDVLGKVNEAGEIKSQTRGEVAESYRLDTYGSIFTLSRQALINDDLGAFTSWATTAGRAAAETENALLFNLLTSSSGAGPIMGEDGKTLFHADHGNVAAAGTALDVANLKQARLALRKQRSLGGKLHLNVKPKYLLVGPELETEAEQILAQIHATTVDDVNPFSNRLELLVEPRLEDTSWYVFADPASVPVLEFAHLTSAPGPQISTREGFETLGESFRVVLDFGCGAIEHRGAYRNPGN